MTAAAVLDAVRIGLAVFGAASVLAAVAMAFDVLGSATWLVHGGEGLASHWWGFPFRGTYSRWLVRMFALGLLILGLDGFGAAAGVPVNGMSGVIVLLGWAYILFNALVWVRSGGRRLLPLIGLPILVALVAIHFVFVFGIAPRLGVPPV